MAHHSRDTTGEYGCEIVRYRLPPIESLAEWSCQFQSDMFPTEFQNFPHQIMNPSRLMTMSPLYPCGKPCSRGTHNEIVKNLALVSSIINGIMMESRLRMSVLRKCFQFFNRIENSITFTPSKIVIHKSRNLIGTEEIAQFGPK